MYVLLYILDLSPPGFTVTTFPSYIVYRSTIILYNTRDKSVKRCSQKYIVKSILSLDITRNSNIYINLKITHNTIRSTLTFRNIFIYLMTYILLFIKLKQNKDT